MVMFPYWTSHSFNTFLPSLCPHSSLRTDIPSQPSSSHHVSNLLLACNSPQKVLDLGSFYSAQPGATHLFHHSCVHTLHSPFPLKGCWPDFTSVQQAACCASAVKNSVLHLQQSALQVRKGPGISATTDTGRSCCTCAPFSA